MENDAVRLINLHLFSVHDDESLVQVNREECHGIRLMVQRYEMPVVREQRHVLRIIAADRKAQYFGEKAGLVINPVYDDTVVSRIRTQKIIKILRKGERAGG